MHCARQVDFEFDLENDLKIIDPLIDLVQQVVSSQDLLESTDRVRMCVAVEHALQNAMLRGNLEIKREEVPVVDPGLVNERSEQSEFADRRVYFRFTVTPDRVDFTVRDQGPGFDVSTIPQAGDPESFKDGIGRGLVLIQAFMEDVQFSDGGRELKMSRAKK
jgi:signal transduction histidine kinase